MPHWVCQSGKKNFYLNNITCKKMGGYIKGCMPHGSSWIVLCKFHNQIHATNICCLFFSTHGCHLETWNFLFFLAVNTSEPYASKQAIFSRMSQGGRINVLKLGMNNPSDQDFLFLKCLFLTNSIHISKFIFKSTYKFHYKSIFKLNARWF